MKTLIFLSLSFLPFVLFSNDRSFNIVIEKNLFCPGNHFINTQIVSQVDVVCFGDANGSATISAEPVDDLGNPDGNLSSIIWTDPLGNQVGSSSPTHLSETGMISGIWIVSVLDDLGCNVNIIITISSPPEMIIDLSNYSSPSCFGNNDGDLTVVIFGGNPYSLGNVEISSLTGGVITTSSLTVNNIIADTYTVSVIDDIGCTTTESIIITEPGEINIDFSLTHTDCFGDGTGMISVDTVYNYQGQYLNLNYHWTNAINTFFGLNQNVTGLEADSYILNIVDENGCQKSFDFEILSPDSLYFDEIGLTNCVGGADGEVYVTVEGGGDINSDGLDYSYLWTEVSTGLTHNDSIWDNLNAGDYIIVVTNDLGCTITDTLTIGCLSNNEFNSESFLKVYPTIVNDGKFVVKCIGLDFSTNKKVLLFDLLGKKVFEEQLVESNQVLNPNLKNGEYVFVIINSNSDVIEKGKLTFISK